MIEQLKTIRAGVAEFAEGDGQKGLGLILEAVTQLEAMVGKQEPVAWVECDGELVWNNREAAIGRNLYTAAPVAQQYEAGDMASAAAQGFRDGVASVTQQEPVAWQRRMKPVWGGRDYLWSPWEECSKGTAEDCWKTPLLHEWAYEARALYTYVHVAQRPQAKGIGEADLSPDEGDPIALWAEIWRLREAIKGPDGYATWQDAATAERIRRVRAESKHAAPVAQQPQAETDESIAADAYGMACDEMERWQHERRKAGKDAGTTGSLVDGIAWLYGYINDLEAKQPQAEAVPPGYVLVAVDALTRWRAAFSEEMSAWDTDPPDHIRQGWREIDALIDPPSIDPDIDALAAAQKLQGASHE